MSVVPSKHFKKIRTILMRYYTIPSHFIQNASKLVSKKNTWLYQEEIDAKISQELSACSELLRHSSMYYFTNGGKRIRPRLTCLVSAICNSHGGGNIKLAAINEHQSSIAAIVEMIHTSSLTHDDVIDMSELRRNMLTLPQTIGNYPSVLVGNFILSRASMILGRINRPDVTSLLAQVIDDLVRGELSQIGSKCDKALGNGNYSLMFEEYLNTIYKKTASLFANSFKAVALLSNHPEPWQISENAFQFGKNYGLVFQIIDDMLDFTSGEDELGKKTNMDISNGLITAPMIIAAKLSPEMNSLLVRRFTGVDDVRRAIGIIRSEPVVAGVREFAYKYVALAEEAALKMSPNLKIARLLFTHCKEVVERRY